MTSAASAVARSVGHVLPRGRSLPDDVWRRRHKALLALLSVHPPVIAVLAVAQGVELTSALAEAGVVLLIALAAALATRSGRSRALPAGLVSFGLITCSAVVVHVSGGVIEAHFHFFVMLGALLLYEEWFPYLLALAYVVVHHGVVGTVDPASVYNHHGAWESPWKWAAIHGLFVWAASVTSIVAWRLNEDVRAETRAAYERARTNEEELRQGQLRLTTAEELAQIGSWEWNIRTNEVAWSPQLYRLWGVGGDREPTYERFLESVHPDDRALVEAAVMNAVATREPYECEFRVVRGDTDVRVVHSRGKVIVDDTGVPVRMVGAAQDITDRKEIERERERLLIQQHEQVERLRELDRLKDVLIASVSHELRTPLTSIRGYLELMREGEAGALTDEQERFLEIVCRNADRLVQVVGDLLFVAQVDAGRMTLERGEVDLAAIARESVESARQNAEAKRIELVVVANGVPRVSGDGARLGQVLDNLVSNAVKFTPEGGRVEVATGRENGLVALSVSDTGIGISKDEQDQLFERFFRTRAASERSIQGTGLGLSIVRAIVHAHGGTIAVASEEGAGTTFRVELPLAPPADERDGAHEAPEEPAPVSVDA